MSTLTKSPLRVVREAIAVAQRRLRCYCHQFSPKKFTQPQLFACLVLKAFLKTDYRGLVAHLADHSDLRDALGLQTVPHFTTPQKASRRLLRQRVAKRLFRTTVRRFSSDAYGSNGRHWIPRAWTAAMRAATTSAVGTASQSNGNAYLTADTPSWKRPSPDNCDSHLMVGVLTGRGPRPDTDRFVPLLDATLANVGVDAALADAGYDSEPNHRYAREHRGVRSFIPATAGRPTAKLPTGRHRRRMRQRLNKAYGSYGQRSQAECGFSMFKRRLGSTVNGRTYQSQCRDLLLMAITYNIMLR